MYSNKEKEELLNRLQHIHQQLEDLDRIMADNLPGLRISLYLEQFTSLNKCEEKLSGAELSYSEQEKKLEQQKLEAERKTS
ncbi:hypothetical protein J9303_11035 [Bacillaceae bacterium Marseille-Q3522]|nr:hypothetical protein [Bacillaceae bacterium Marseille-Q3522]